MTRPAPTPLSSESPAPAQPAKDVMVSVAATGLERDRFIRFQEEIYRGDPNFVPPLLMERHEFLDPGKNPFFLHADVALLLATRGGKPVGRIAAVEDRNYNAFQGTKAAAFGLFECVDDPGVAAALLAAVRNWARWRGLTSLIGPMSFSSNHEIGLLVEGFDDPPFVMMPYNPRYYEDLLLACGLKKAKDLYSFWRTARTPPPERFVRVADKIKSHAGIALRTLDIRNFEGEVARIKGIYNSAWEKNWGFVPMTDAEFDKLARDLKSILRPELCFIAEEQGEPVAFSLTVPDVNRALRHVGGRLTSFGLPLGLAKLIWYQKRIDRVRMLALGIKEGWRRRGLDAVLIVETIRRTGELGYEGGEVGWTLEDNDLINRAIEGVGGQRSRVHRVFEGAVE
ncbi:MAG TPA: N-acetyltransferase [Anaeromyxobacteraceae bacterium]|nr:N-acetyltransferase [Anaeromyxobacteraceae bacterium]